MRQLFIYARTGECCESENVQEAIRTLQRFYKETLTPETVVPEEEYNRLHGTHPTWAP